MTDRDVAALIERAKNRAIANFMGWVEREANRHLPADVRRNMRRAFLQEINDLADVAIEAVDAVADPADVVNGEWLERIERRIEDLHHTIAGRAHLEPIAASEGG
jgi:hypothetical protein